MSSFENEKGCNVHLHAEVELLKKALADKQVELNAMRSVCYHESERQGELEDVVLAWQDKFERLYESHKKVQKINQNLEDKLLKLVDRNTGEKAQLTSDCATLNIRLSQANYNISSLQREIERYKQDINLAIQLLQCKPDSFLPQKINSLPLETQIKVTSYMKLDSESECSVGNKKYQILPTNDDDALLNSTFSSHSLDLNKNGELKVSPGVVAKYLEHELKAKNPKHCDTCSCSTQHLIDLSGMFNIATQTEITTMSCLRCNSNLNSPSHTNSPYLAKLKSSDSVISETKSSVSDFATQNEKSVFTPKKDDLMVNPILGHHRLCEHKSFNFTPTSPPNDEKPIINDSVPGRPESNVSKEKEKINGSEVKVKVIQTSTLQHGAGNGSNNSLWSKESNKEGAKLFENFNRNLIKTMRAENPRLCAPRICALKIQNGSSTLLDNTLGETRQVMYTRRNRLLDEELLDDEKEISGNLPINFTSSSQSSLMVLSTASNQSNNQNDEVFSTNKTDSEKFNEIHSKDVVSSKILSPEKKSLVVKECEIKSSKKVVDPAVSEVAHDTLLLRRQQLTRVAEWVQNSIPLPNTPEQTLGAPGTSSKANLDLENNNSTLVNQKYNDSIPAIYCESNAQNEMLNMNDTSVLGSKNVHSDLDCHNEEKKDLDLVQMEYNVKKFLLKQNEWSISKPESIDTYSIDSNSEQNDETLFIKSSYQRTETNL